MITHGKLIVNRQFFFALFLQTQVLHCNRKIIDFIIYVINRQSNCISKKIVKSIKTVLICAESKTAMPLACNFNDMISIIRNYL